MAKMLPASIALNAAARSEASVFTVTAVPTKRMPSNNGRIADVIALNRSMQSEIAQVTES